MSQEERSFNENLDLLIKLLRKLKDKTSYEEYPGMPKMFLANFDFVINNYEMMKNQISEQLLSQFGEPIKKMVADMVDQLKEELGDDFELETEQPATKIVLKETDDTMKAIAQIDALLTKAGLTEEELNKLLDERSRLKKRLSSD
jgi:hypothetical protein